MNIPGRVLGEGRPAVINRRRYGPYINVAIKIPNPWNVIPAIKIGYAASTGWVPPINEARVPHNMMGNTGRIHAGVMDWIVSGFPVKRKKYCPTATQKVRAAYTQKKTLRVTSNQVPQRGTAYNWMLERILTTEIQNVGKKSDSVGCVRHFARDFGYRVKRVMIVAVKRIKRMMERMKKISPIAVSP